MDRRKALIGCMLVQAGLGSVLTWALLFTCLNARLCNAPAPHCDWVLTACILALAASVLFAGLIPDILRSDGLPHKKAAISSAVLIGGGFAFASLIDLTFLPQAVAVSVILGTGAGAAYVSTLDITMLWYPEKKGTAAGFMLAASTFGGLTWFRVGESLLRCLSPQGMFLAVGACSVSFILAGTFLISAPTPGYVPPVWRRPENPLAGIDSARSGIGEILGKPAFYLIMAAMALTGGVTVFFCGNIHTMGSGLLAAKGLEVQLAGRITLLAAVIFAISDGLGKIVGGVLSDNVGVKGSIAILGVAEALVLLILSNSGAGGSVLIFASFALGMALGATTAMFPCAVSEHLGERDFFPAYSLILAVFISVAAGAFQLSALAREGAGPAAWPQALLLAAACPLAGAVAMPLLKKAKRGEPAPEKDLLAEERAIEPETGFQSEEAQPEDNKNKAGEENEAVQQDNRETEDKRSDLE